MAWSAAPAGLLAAAPALRRRVVRRRAALLLAALVGAWHAWLVDQWVPVAPAAGTPRPGLVQLRSLPAAAPPTMPPEVATPSAPPDNLPTTARQPDGHPPQAEALAAKAAPAEPMPAVQANPTPDGEPGIDSDPAMAGKPPPVHATRLPPPAQLRYLLWLNGQAGSALLAWQQDGQRYRLTLDGRGPAGEPWLMQASDGALDSHGLAPERFVDRRRDGRTQAANFRRDAGPLGGQISYSGPAVVHPAWPGAQDRLSWLVQVVALLAAAEGAVPAEWQLFVTDARGQASLWQLQRQPDETGATPWGPQLQQHWRREPPRPEGLRIDLWLPATPDGPAGPWPLRLRLQVPRSGHVLELVRADTP